MFKFTRKSRRNPELVRVFNILDDYELERMNEFLNDPAFEVLKVEKDKVQHVATAMELLQEAKILRIITYRRSDGYDYNNGDDD